MDRNGGSGGGRGEGAVSKPKLWSYRERNCLGCSSVVCGRGNWAISGEVMTAEDNKGTGTKGNSKGGGGDKGRDIDTELVNTLVDTGTIRDLRPNETK